MYSTHESFQILNSHISQNNQKQIHIVHNLGLLGRAHSSAVFNILLVVIITDMMSRSDNETTT